MDIVFEKIIQQHIENELQVNRMIVTLFVEVNNIKVKNNLLIKELLISKTDAQYLEIANFISSFSFEDLIKAFEIAIPAKDKQTNGAIYTPKSIKEFIISGSLKEVKKPLEEVLGADISCGCGAFLYSLANEINKKTKQSFQKIIETQLYGLDVNDSSIFRAKILLTLLALSKGEDKKAFQFNLFTANALEFNWQTISTVQDNQGFDLIVGNPPYVRAKNLDLASKSLLKNWQVTKSGNPDLYIPFFEIGYENLNEQGVLGYITVNSFYRSVNARSLRTYFQTHKIRLKIIDFGHEQVFSNKLTYTCICFLSKVSSKNIYFAKRTLTTLFALKEKNFTKIPYHTLDDHRGWLLNNSKAIHNIQKIEKCGKPLGKSYVIKNGIATLSNNTYIFRPSEENKSYYFFKKNGESYKVEKGICRDIIKPNILKYEHEIPKIKEKIIYPYTDGIAPLSLIKEDKFKRKFPFAYQYLSRFKEQLAKRDKGNGDYAAWYAFGRTQALMDKGLKLLFPYMSKHPFFVFTDQKDLLLYCGYAIFSESQEELLVLKKLLESDVFDYYMQNTSKPYAAGYYSYAKNYVKNFGVCELNPAERKYLLKENEKEKINKFFEKKYDLNLV
ncbi:MAG: adenine-specific DNA-methyltransferase [Paraglaciecola sp.]|jgi:adenine-specific DNA-methyltransferase